MDDWRTATLADVAVIIGRGVTPKYSDSGAVVVLNQKCIRDGRVDLHPSRRHDSIAKPVTPEKLLRIGDVLVNSTGTGTLGRIAAVRSLTVPTTVDSHVTIVRPQEWTDARWLGYSLLASQSMIEAMAEGSTGQTELSRYSLSLLPLPIPSLREQRAIAEVLGALDDKIEANRRLAGLCDSTWRAIAASELDGELVPLSRLARFVNGGAYTKGASGTGKVVIRTPELTSGPTGTTVYSDRDVPADQLARPGDLLFVWSGSLAAHRWHRTEAIINQHIFKVIPSPGIPMWLVHDRILGLLPEFISIAADKATTMGHIQRHHLDTPVLLPNADRLVVLDVACAPLWDRALAAERESLVLTQLRDFLLPRLVSGELRVRDADPVVKEAV